MGETNNRDDQCGKKNTDLKHSIQDHPISILARSATPCRALRSWQVCRTSLFWVPAHPQHPPCRRIAEIAGNRIRPPSSQRVPRSLPPSSPTHPTTGRHIFRETSVKLSGWWFQHVSTLPPWKMMEWKSDWIIIPTIGKNTCSKPSTSCLFKTCHCFWGNLQVVEKLQQKKSHHPNHPMVPNGKSGWKKNTSNLQQPNSNTISTMEIGNILQSYCNISHAPCMVYLSTKLGDV